ncbi:hypothetical protein K438DRAFT_1777949 [Mycena galopus ATCC 62051]|nr:hypothetical protein K438DRAFT_1777949 [Mycena galopus ATCC 62051]
MVANGFGLLGLFIPTGESIPNCRWCKVSGREFNPFHFGAPPLSTRALLLLRHWQSKYNFSSIRRSEHLLQTGAYVPSPVGKFQPPSCILDGVDVTLLLDFLPTRSQTTTRALHDALPPESPIAVAAAVIAVG